MKLFLLALALIIGSTGPSFAEEQENYDISGFKARLEKSGIDMLCGSEEYRMCLEVSEEKCKKEISEAHRDCVNQTLDKAAVIKDDFKLASHYAACVNLSHTISNYMDRLYEIRTCNEENATNMDQIVERYFSDR